MDSTCSGELIKPSTPEMARKKISQPDTWKRKREQISRYRPKRLPLHPKCKHCTKSYRCAVLTLSDMHSVHKAFYSHQTKQEQDNFIIKLCNVRDIKRRRAENSDKKRQFSIVYNIPKALCNKTVPVCRQAFTDILGVGKDRVIGVLNRFTRTGHMASETRGGDRKLNAFSERKKSVMNFIEKFRVIESHYCRNRTNRKYLSSDLSIRKMWGMYSAEHKENLLLLVKESYFRNIFNTCYNIGFGSPRTDVCSTCLQLYEKIKSESNEDEKKTLMTERHIHRLRAKAFFNYLKEEKPELITISFDCQKNQVLPKLPDQSVYYSRQLYIYNFTIVTGSSHSALTKDNVAIYAWTEDEYHKGSNEIASAVFHKLCNLDFTNKETVRLIADGCGGQNKNSILLTMCIKWLGQFAPKSVTKMEIIFPVVDHSFIPPDRVFARIEKVIKKIDTIVEVEEYLKIFSDHGTVFKLGKDVNVCNWKESCKFSIKPTGQWHFSFNQSKRFILTRGRHTIMIRGEQSYLSDLGVSKNVFKKGKNFININATPVEIGVSPNETKIKDVETLLIKHYGNKWKETNPKLKYYKNVLEKSGENIDEDNGHEVSEELCEHADYVADMIV